jgi:fructan beta-fructosidase
MSRSAATAALLLALAPAVASRGARGDDEAAAYREPYRPRFHFTPERNWMNDPNGLVFHEGEYHLFYQYNPFGDRWGHMSWGHAVSRDLVRWQHLPLAIPEENGVMAFSGSAVVDWKNTSGFGRDGRPPLVAIYTGHHTTRPLQDQRLAYSNDRGRTWTRYAGNPVLDIGQKDFRDPKVFWHSPTHRWVMVVAWPEQRMVRLYASRDLRSWSHLSDFGPAGATQGAWECPDLFPLPVPGATATRWVLIVNVNPGAPAGGSGTQYFVGQFDGRRFVAEGREHAALWLDHGPDHYATVTWSDIPSRDGRRIALGWMSNWAYAPDLPTAPWRGAMTVPRELALVPTPAGLRVRQRPVRELESLRVGKPRRFDGGTLAEAVGWLARQAPLPALADVELELSRLAESTPVSVALRTGPEELVVLSLEAFGGGRFAVDRARSGLVAFNDAFALPYGAPVRVTWNRCRLRLLVDASSLEVFAQDGETTLTQLLFPAGRRRELLLSATGPEPPRVSRITIHELAPAWPAGPP